VCGGGLCSKRKVFGYHRRVGCFGSVGETSVGGSWVDRIFLMVEDVTI